MPYPKRIAARRPAGGQSATVRTRPNRTAPLATAGVLAALALAASSALAQSPPDPFEVTPEMRATGRRLSAHPGGAAEKGDRIVDYIFERKGGLGFRFRSYPTLTAAEAFELREGNCLTLVNLFISLARSGGLRAYPIEVEDLESFSRRGSTVIRSHHVIAALEVGGAVGPQIWTVDFLPDRPKTYRRFRSLTDAQFTSLFYSSVGVEALLAGDPERADRLFAEAIEHDPRSAEAWSNWAVLAARSGDRGTARERYSKALEIDPAHLPALNNLAALHRLEGRVAAAEVLEERALAERRQSPYFLTEQALRELRRGRLDEADALLRRARRIDDSIPEIHLAFGRIDLRRGRVDRAEEHFAAARRLAVEESPAFRAGLDRKIDKLEKLAAAH